MISNLRGKCKCINSIKGTFTPAQNHLLLNLLLHFLYTLSTHTLKHAYVHI